jgi:pyruvate kinase
METLRQHILDTREHLLSAWRPMIQRRTFEPSAQNLASYLAMRQHDLRDLQAKLTPWGLSSLGRCESHVEETIDSVIATLQSLHRLELREAPEGSGFFLGENRLIEEADRVFGPARPGRRERIMVTFPTEAATNYTLVRDLVERGMNIARVNCAHDSLETWAEMIANVRRAEAETGKPCKVQMDLAGPKVRVAKTSFKRKQRFFKEDNVLWVRESPGSSKEFPYQFSCTLQEAFDAAQPGHMVWVDDGILGARVASIRPEGIELVVEQVCVEGERIRPEKGLNFPDTPLDIPALTERDLEDLDFVAENADIVALSFVQTLEDVEHLLAELEKRVPDPERRARIAIVEKIEKPKAVANLPELIVAAAGRQPLAVMIARGDLAVEIGFQRLAEIQEEIMWICEAAHVPVIWATQVFETFVKTGVPTRSEITDAAMAERAECVMLNKGDFIVDAVALLDDVLIRMEGHQFKKRPELRALKSWPIPITAPSVVAEESAAPGLESQDTPDSGDILLT